ncbi:MAG: ribonuclease [Gallionella sp.]|nr:ribonuclease [Gallionella sp.]MDD4959124.1 ribonuclease [Gallionella sp.]
MTYARYFFISLVLMFGLFGTAEAWDHGRSHQHEHAAQAAVLSEVLLANLPAEARDTLRLIKQGGPFPYPRDGVVFSNREKVLPKQYKGYYHEYTVKTPGLSHRGARRIVSGVMGEYYYTGDHYQSFQRIKE